MRLRPADEIIKAMGNQHCRIDEEAKGDIVRGGVVLARRVVCHDGDRYM
ncbi:hypothetical protein [Paraburkholderia youngii]